MLIFVNTPMVLEYEKGLPAQMCEQPLEERLPYSSAIIPGEDLGLQGVVILYFASPGIV